MRRLLIVDTDSDVPNTPALVLQTGSLPAEMGKNLDTIAKARQWLTHPQNWHDTNMFIIKWDGLTPSISKQHGMRLIRETHDDGLPTVVVIEQRNMKNGKKSDPEEVFE